MTLKWYSLLALLVLLGSSSAAPLEERTDGLAMAHIARRCDGGGGCQEGPGA
ncbi:hypothetical protein OBBRIDRAFT_795088 [Obba rivulosa]|uniref:Uncharacterized protein n=1 Tax=Obba rivulosa TaxID=1052685 RepID=A0A8E2DIU5_9APHY|nr:hypothetical protein OBBRIDRAFT_795088 [Obba rivulosa]